MPQELINMMAGEPLDTPRVVQEKWYELGRMNLEDLIEYFPESVDNHSFKESMRLPGLWGQQDLNEKNMTTGIGRYIKKTASSSDLQ